MGTFESFDADQLEVIRDALAHYVKNPPESHDLNCVFVAKQDTARDLQEKAEEALEEL